MFAKEKYRLAGEKMAKLIALFSGSPSLYLLEDLIPLFYLNPH